jgi:hypothetical protein
MHRIAHRRRGSKFGRNPVRFFLVPSRLLPLALSTSSLQHFFALTLPPRSRGTDTFDLAGTPTGTVGDTFVLRHRLLPSFLLPASASMLTAGPLLCL